MLDMILDHSKYIALFLGLAAGFPLMWRRRERLGFQTWWQILFLCLFFTTASVLSALLFASFERLVTGGGLAFGAISTYGVYFFCPLFLFLAAKASRVGIRDGFDLYAIYALPSLFFLRINCLISGCCGGTHIPGTELHWPTRQAEMLFYAAMLLVFLRREKRGAAAGQNFPLLMAAYGCFRFVEEWVRETSGSSALHLAHLWSVLAAALGLSICIELQSRRARVAVPMKIRRKAQ